MSTRGQSRGQGDPGVRTQQSLDPHRSQLHHSPAPRLMGRGQKGTEALETQSLGVRADPQSQHPGTAGMVVSPGWSQHGDGHWKSAGLGGFGHFSARSLREAGTREGVEARAGNLAETLSWKAAAGAAGAAAPRRGSGVPKRDPPTPCGTRIPLLPPDREIPGRVTARKRRKGTKNGSESTGKAHLLHLGTPRRRGTQAPPDSLLQHSLFTAAFSNNPNKWGLGKVTVFFQAHKYKQSPTDDGVWGMCVTPSCQRTPALLMHYPWLLFFHCCRWRME